MAEYAATEIFKGLYAIDEGMVRSYLLVGDGEALLIDTGACGGDLKAFVKAIAGCEPRLLTTHADRDHVSAHGQFETAYMHPAEFSYYAAKGGDAGKMRPLWEGDRFSAGEYTLETILIPGHTPGSVAFLDRRRRILISGDSISKMPIFMFGEGRSFPAYIASMEKLEALRPLFDTALASHGDAVLDASLIPLCIEGAKAFLAGELTGEEPGRPLPAKVYTYKDVRFLAQ